MRVLLPIICSGQARRADGSNSPTALKPRTRRSRPPAPRGRPPPRSDPHFNPIRAHSSCKDRGGGSCCPRRQGISGGRDSLVGPRDPPPLPAPTRGGGCANVINSIQMQQAPRRPWGLPWPGAGPDCPELFPFAARSQNRPPAAFAKARKRRAITPRSGLASWMGRSSNRNEPDGEPHGRPDKNGLGQEPILG